MEDEWTESFDPLSAFNIVPVSDPDAIEDQLSAFGGFTQSETDTAKCGDTIVVGFNDSGSFIQTLVGGVSPSGSFSFNGWSRSSDSGDTFDDRGVLLADPLPPGILFRDLGGDPLIECTDPDTYYYGSLATDFLADFSSILSGISVSKSTNGGRDFGGAVMAVAKDAFFHFLDKPWMAVDPVHRERIYLTYTDFDFSSSSAACGADVRTAIELVVSEDGGQTWTDPLVITEVCGFDFVQGSQVVVSPHGEVYVAWEDFADDFFGPRQLLIRRSDDGGASFQTVRKVSDVTPVGDGFLLKGSFRAAFEFPSMAVDRSKYGTRGNVYVAWSDGRRAATLDALFRRVPIRRHLHQPFRGCRRKLERTRSGQRQRRGDQGDRPVPTGARRRQTGYRWRLLLRSPRESHNFAIDRFCATSDDAGKTWDNRRVTGSSFAPVPAQDSFVNPVYMGDYDTLASDFSDRGSGFFGAWGDNTAGNPDVRGTRISRELIIAAGE